MQNIELPSFQQAIDTIQTTLSAHAGAAIAAAAALAIVALILLYRAISKAISTLWRAHLDTRAQTPTTPARAAARSAARAAGPLALLGTLGSTVSLYGLFGFATDTAQLPLFFALAFCAIFDVAELTCFVLLYLSAAQSAHWTPSMRKTYRWAWTLVAASAAMNFIHAPGGLAGAITLAAVPVVSAHLVKNGLDRILEVNAGDETVTVNPGPVRLLQLLWLHAWARIFAALGLDATSGDGHVSAEARIRRAATALTDLARKLDEQDTLTTLPATDTGRQMQRRRSRAATRVHRSRVRAQTAIDTAGVATDRTASLSLARHLVARGRAADLARMDVTNPMAVLTLLEELAITPSAEAINAGARVMLAEQAAESADQARTEAEQLRDQAVTAMNTARERTQAAQQERADADEARQKAIAEMTSAQQKAQEAVAAADTAQKERELAEQARDEAEQAACALQADAGATTEARQAAERAIHEAEATHRDVTEQAQRLTKQAQAAVQERDQAEASHRELDDRAQQLRTEVKTLTDQHQQTTAEVARLNAAREEAHRLAEAAQAKAQQDQTAAEQAAQERRAAEAALNTAQTQILALMHGQMEPASDWRSEQKKTGWEHYHQTLRTEGREPTATELHEAVGGTVHPGTVRAWFPEFRTRHASEIVHAASTAHLPDPTTTHQPRSSTARPHRVPA